jgi:hypothetical protein
MSAPSIPPLPDDREQTIDRLWEASNHGTRREDVARAYEAGVAAERERYETLRWLVAGGVDLFKGAPGGGEMTQAEAEKWVDGRVAEAQALSFTG